MKHNTLADIVPHVVHYAPPRAAVIDHAMHLTQYPPHTKTAARAACVALRRAVLWCLAAHDASKHGTLARSSWMSLAGACHGAILALSMAHGMDSWGR